MKNPLESSQQKRDRRRVLLWSPRGAGKHYHGPGIAAYRLYASCRDTPFELTLGHGFEGQADLSLFRRQHFISKYSGRAVAQLKFFAAAYGWIRQNIDKFDAFHGVSSYHACALPATWAQRSGVPAVLRVARYQSDLADKGGLRDILGLPRRRRRLVAQLSGMIAISSAIAEELIGYGVPERKIALIPNGVDIGRFAPLEESAQKSALRRALGWKDEITILFVGALNRRKQPHVLLRAAQRLREKGHDFHLVFVGPEDDVAYVRRMKGELDAHSLRSRVTWFGFTKSIAQLYQAADIFVLPSKGEGMSNALLEAMSSGLAVVSTDVSGARDAIVDGETGTLLEDTSELGAVLESYLCDDDVRKAHGDAARARLVKGFSAAAVHSAHESLFQQVCSSGGIPANASLLTVDGAAR